MQAVNEPGRVIPLSATKTRRDRATRDPPPSPEVRCFHTPGLASNAITLACPAQMGATEQAEPLTAKVALHAILVGVVGQLAQPTEVRRSIPQPTHLTRRDRHGVLPAAGIRAVTPRALMW